MGNVRKDGKPCVTVRRILELLREGMTTEKAGAKLGLTAAEIEQRLSRKSGQHATDLVVAGLKVRARLLMAQKLGDVALRLAALAEGDDADKKTVLLVLGRMLAAERRLEGAERAGPRELPERRRVQVKQLPAARLDEGAVEQLELEAEKELEENAEE